MQARKALMDLMELQNKYHQENKKYARNVLDIQKYNLKYNAGVVYLEIESASQDKYRAVALAAESTTARVFAFDTDKGGLYEMKDDEVKSYVLGALKHVRTQQKNVAQKDFISFLLAIILGALGVKSLVKNAQKKFSPPFLYYFTSIFPMTWAFLLLNHMTKNVVLSQLILVVSITAMLCTIAIILAGGANFAKLSWSDNNSHLHGLLISAIGGSLFSCAAIGYILYRFH